MKKALALILALLMLLSSVAIVASAVEEPEVDYWESVTNDLGMNIYVGAPVETAPVLDGVISEGEYSKSVYNAPEDIYNYGNKITSGGLTEYFAHDEEWVYYAIKYESTTGGVAFMWQYKPYNSFDIFNPAGDNSYFYSRVSWQARYSESYADRYRYWNTDYTGSWAPALSNSTKRAPYIHTNMPSAEYEEHHCAAGLADGYAVFEAKVAKSYFAYAGDCVAENVFVVPYFTYLHSADAVGTIYTEDQLAALEAEGAAFLPKVGELGYKFMVLDDDMYHDFVEEPEEDEEPEVTVANLNLEDLYGATYVGKALKAEDAKPVLDGVIGDGEYQVEYVITADGKDAIRYGAQALLLADYKQYVAHDDEYIYFAFDFYNASSSLRGRFYYNLSFIQSFDVQYYGGNTVNGAFQQNGHGLAEGWNFGAEVKADISEGYSERNNAVSFGTAPVKGTDFEVAVGKEDITEPQDEEGNTTTHQVYEIKISKAWYAAQVGLESADDVREVAWIAMGQEANLYGSSYTQFGKFIDNDMLATLNATGLEYVRPASSSHPYDNASLPFLFVLDTDWEKETKNLGLNTYVGAPMEVSPVVDGVITPGEYSYVKTWSPDEIGNYGREIQSGVVEYIAHDADYIYYAAQFVQNNNNRAFQWYFVPSNTFHVFKDKTNLRDTLHQRVVWQLRYQDDGTTTVHQNPGWNYAIADAAPAVGTDLFYAATKDANNVKTYEIKLAKAYIAEFSGCDVADVRVLPYMTYFHSDAYMGHYYTADEAAYLTELGATRADANTALYRFIVLDEADEAADVTANLDVATKDAASIRLSESNSGLRFTTTVNTAEFAALVAKYGVENVKVGTLIAPQDKLDGALTIETAVKVDVVASIEHPFAQNAVNTTFAGSITQIKPQNLERDFTAVGYVAYFDGAEWVYLYSATSCTRNVTEVAQLAVDSDDYANDADALTILKALGAVIAE